VPQRLERPTSRHPRPDPIALKSTSFQNGCKSAAGFDTVTLFSQPGTSMITIETNHGDIVVELFEKEAPLSSANFSQYAVEGFFDDTVFHRVIANFMIQGGGMTENLSSKSTRPPIRNEAANGLKNVRGTLAMARTSQVDSATSQFFINLRDNGFLDHGGRDYGYAVFGKVTEGMDVVDAIARVETGHRAGHDDVPLEAVVIRRVRIDG
jgi:peptidyl-prolyl cis-trans isomerase A (cyclophilin A)/peptidyl-prolyl cis-trans isomerase B (cyclophilin B)